MINGKNIRKCKRNEKPDRKEALEEEEELEGGDEAEEEKEPEGEEELEEEEDHQYCSSDTDSVNSAINVIHCRKQLIILIFASHVFRIL